MDRLPWIDSDLLAWPNVRILPRILFTFLFFVVFTTVIMKIIFGIIVDAFKSICEFMI